HLHDRLAAPWARAPGMPVRSALELPVLLIGSLLHHVHADLAVAEPPDAPQPAGEAGPRNAVRASPGLGVTERVVAAPNGEHLLDESQQRAELVSCDGQVAGAAGPRPHRVPRARLDGVPRARLHGAERGRQV